jgi:histidyl-tRNA synthetase
MIKFKNLWKSKMKYERCKGFRDFNPAEMNNFRSIETAFREACSGWDFNEVRTPTLEYLHLFTSTGTLTPGMLNKVYSFLDWDGWSGERVVLRPDGTIPIARYYIENLPVSKLARLFYITNIFIFEETGREYRERWQGGVELIGVGSPLADVELIMLAGDVLRSLLTGKIVLKLSHAGVIKALLSELGLSHEEQTEMYDKILDGDVSSLSNISPEKSGMKQLIAGLLDFKGKSSALLDNLRGLYENELPALREPLDNFIAVTRQLDALNVEYYIDMDTGRGFEYYTGIIFHFSVEGTDIVGGGRYDGLIPFMSGKDVPASGFALYIDRLMTILGHVESEERKTVLITVDPDDTDSAKAGFQLADFLHRHGIHAGLGIAGIVPGPSEWLIKPESGKYTIANSKTQKKKTVENTGELIRILKNERNNKSRTTQGPSSR